MKYKTTVVSVYLALTSLTLGGDTNFVSTFNSQWVAGNATNVLVYIEDQLATNRRPETLFARGLVAMYLQEWGRGATNYLGQAVSETSTNTSYSAEGRTNIIQLINQAQADFKAVVAHANEPTNSVALWNTNTHIVIFSELGDELPYLQILSNIATNQ